MELKTSKPFEKPPAGPFLGRIIDFIELKDVPSTYNGVTTTKDKIALVWMLTNEDGTPALNKEGKSFTMRDTHNASMHNKPGQESGLYKRVEQVLGTPPPVISKSEELEILMLNRTGYLFLIKAKNPKDANDPYTNISGVTPLPPAKAALVPPTPADYIRVKNRPPKPPYGQQQGSAAAPASAPAPAVSFAQPAQPVAPAGTQPANLQF